MSQNDVIVLKANFESWKSRVSGVNGIQPWLYYCVEQIAKRFALTDEEIQYSITDGGSDGGADAILFLVNNGVLVQDNTDLEATGASRIRLIFIQVKTSGGFSHVEIDKLGLLTDDFLNLSQGSSGFSQKYNSNVLQIMKTFKEGFLQVSGSFPEIFIDYYYMVGADQTPDANATAAADRVIAKVKGHLSKATCDFHFINAEALWGEVQKRPRLDKRLIWSEAPMQAKEGYAGLVKLKDFYDFLQDETGVLAERIFESNVRGFQQSTPVNTRIRDSLHSPSDANFWLLNNGVTIISSKVSSAGHLQLTLEDPQIVNGLQTSREVFHYFTEDKPKEESRSILVRVIESLDNEVIDLVIRATNSQNKMSESSLRMTEPIHRKIEDLMKQYDFFYDRRKGFYKDQGRPAHKIIGASLLAQWAASVLLQRPDDARARPGDYFNKDEKYEKLFTDNAFPLGVYVACVRIGKAVESFMAKTTTDRGERRNLQFYVVSAVACELTLEVDPTPEQVLKAATPEAISNIDITSCFKRVQAAYATLTATADRDVVARGPELLKVCRAETKSRFAPTLLDKIDNEG